MIKVYRQCLEIQRQIEDGRGGDAMDLWVPSSHLLVKSWSAQSRHLHYSRYMYCTTLTLAHLVIFNNPFSFFFSVENSISCNPQAHSQYKSVLSSIRSIIHQCPISGSGKNVVFWEIPMLSWNECWEFIQKHVIHLHLQSMLAPMIHISQNPPHPSSLFFPWYFWGMPGCGSDINKTEINGFI